MYSSFARVRALRSIGSRLQQRTRNGQMATRSGMVQRSMPSKPSTAPGVHAFIQQPAHGYNIALLGGNEHFIGRPRVLVTVCGTA